METKKTLQQEQVESVVAHQIKSAMNWELFIALAILILPVMILSGAGIYAAMPFPMKLGFWLVLYITYYKFGDWVVSRKVRHIVEKLREASE